jgi:two-component system sensor histidine kinase RpfC
MTTDVEATNKPDTALRAVLLPQAKLRMIFASPVLVGEICFYPGIGGQIRWPFIAFVAVYCVYCLSTFLLARFHSPIKYRHLLTATTVLDPIALSGWIIFADQYGGLISGFYLFTVLGFGFRAGRARMHVCQFFSVAGFVGVLCVSSFWQHHVVVWCSLLITLLIVPLYAGELVKQLHTARDRAERESNAKSQLLAKVSHELRTPLTGIIAAAELLALESEGLSTHKRTETILALSNELLQEINDLLDSARYGALDVELKNEPLDLSEEFALVAAAVETTAVKKGVIFQTELDLAIRDRVVGDAHHLRRVLINLAGNAVKFSEKGGVVRLGARLVEESREEYRLNFSVTDTGIGIPEEFHSRIFEPFSQVDQGASRRYGGTGLGLWISKQIVAAFKGDLQFESVPGRGSKFWFYLTMPRIAKAEVVAAIQSPDAVRSRRILVAEDNLTNLHLLREQLEIDGHEVTTCATGMEALEQLAEKEFDLLLLDYNLGDMDGIRVLQTYRFGRLNPAPALFLTADATMQTANRLNEAGCAGILYKPIKLTELRKALIQVDTTSHVANAPSMPYTAPPAGPVKVARPALTAVPVSPIDMNAIDELRAISPRTEFLGMILSEAVNDITRNSGQLVDMLSNKEHASVRGAAHALKGVGASVGAVRIVALASSLMTASREELDSSGPKLVMDLQETVRITVSALKKLAGEAPGGSAQDAASLHLD